MLCATEVSGSFNWLVKLMLYISRMIWGTKPPHFAPFGLFSRNRFCTVISSLIIQCGTCGSSSCSLIMMYCIWCTQICQTYHGHNSKTVQRVVTKRRPYLSYSHAWLWQYHPLGVFYFSQNWAFDTAERIMNSSKTFRLLLESWGGGGCQETPNRTSEIDLRLIVQRRSSAHIIGVIYFYLGLKTRMLTKIIGRK